MQSPQLLGCYPSNDSKRISSIPNGACGKGQMRSPARVASGTSAKRGQASLQRATVRTGAGPASCVARMDKTKIKTKNVAVAMVLQGVLAGILLKLGYSGAPISLAARVRRPGESVSQDITFRLLCLNERRLARMPVVLDGLTGVGKTFPLKVYAGKPRGFECANWRVVFGSWYTLLVGKRSQTKTTEYEGVPARHTLAFPLTRPQPATRDTPRMCILLLSF